MATSVWSVGAFPTGCVPEWGGDAFVPLRCYGALRGCAVPNPGPIALWNARWLYPMRPGRPIFLFIGWNHLCCELAQRGNAWQFLTTGRLWLR